MKSTDGISRQQTLWVDLTSSIHSVGGIIGIIRAELELAVGLYRTRQNVRFFCLKDEGLAELAAAELDWLLTSQNVADAFMARQKRRNFGALRASSGGSSTPLPSHIRHDVERVTRTSASRFERFRTGRRLVVEALAPGWRQIARISTAPVVAIWGIASKVGSAVTRVHAKFSTPGRSTAPKKFGHPFANGDIVFSAGFMLNDKERVIEQVKNTGTKIYLGYLIYDIILIGETTRHYYPEFGNSTFQAYFDWTARNCDFLIYGGETAQRDSLIVQQERGLPTPSGAAIRFGGDLGKSATARPDDDAILERLGLTGPFMITVGSIEGRKNHETLYRAFVILLEKMGENAPQLVFVGRPDPYSTSDLIDTLNRDPRIQGKLLVMQPTDEELDTLYRHCLFTLLPTLYEGWSLTLPESLGYGKLCLCSDVAPLHEIAGDLVDYLDPWDVMAWAEAMQRLVENTAELSSRNARITANWHNTTWQECATNLSDTITKLLETDVHFPAAVQEHHEHPIWVDLTLSYLVPQRGLSGIIRAELLFARELRRLRPSTRFFACDNGKFFEIPEANIKWLVEGDNLSADFIQFNQQMNERASAGLYRSPFANRGSLEAQADDQGGLQWLKRGPRFINPYDAREGLFYLASIWPAKWRGRLFQQTIKFRQARTETAATLPPALSEDMAPAFFPDGSIVLLTGIDWPLTTLAGLRNAPNRSRLFLTHVLYDMTPTITPHLHVSQSPPVYLKFIEIVSNNFDFLFFGGKTSQRDAEIIQRRHGFKIPESVAIQFGGNIAQVRNSSQTDEELLASVGVTGKFLLAVGTIENRKNHDTLYKAYIRLLNQDGDVPQMVFVGGTGWHTGDFMNRVTRDDRVKGKIIIIRASDDQLDALYRNCEFTLLASLYEGWSLTLPESLQYGKFCLTSDVDPLRETGGTLVDYVHPWDVAGWAEKIRYYLDDSQALRAREKAIAEQWRSYTWQECAQDLLSTLEMKSAEHFGQTDTADRKPDLETKP